MDNKRSQALFREKVAECLKAAENLYGVDFGRVTITFDLKGVCCGQALSKPHPNLGKSYSLRFNKEAISKDWDMMVYSTIPHEVAHLVAFADPSLKASGHNRAWKMIAIALGDRDQGSVYHNLKLTPKNPRKYTYNVSGNILELNAKQHFEIQSGSIYICSKTKEIIDKNQFLGIITQR